MEYTIMAAFLLFIVFSIFHSQSGVLSKTHNQDHSYKKFVQNANDLPAKEKYDYIIVGGGTAGCSLAATLSSKYSVLLLERGSDPRSFPTVLNTEGISHTLGDEDDGENPYNHFISEEGVENVRGRVLGGSSMVNLGFYSRAHPAFYNQSGVEWDMNTVEEAYQWVEEMVASQPNINPWQLIFRNALLEVGVLPDNGFDLNHLIGTKTGGSLFDSNGVRHGAVEFLNKANPINIKVAVQATVRRIIFSGLSARGVSYSDSNGKLHRASIQKNGEIILSAGAIGSPQLLLLSGIGPKSNLSSLKIPLVLDRPNVGQFMVDNPRYGVYLVLPVPTPTPEAQAVGILEDTTILETVPTTFPFTIPPTFSLLPPHQESSSVNLSLATLIGKFINVSSFGSLRLASTNVNKNPIVRFNYFSHPDDLARCVRGIRIISDLLNTKTLEAIKTRDLEGVKGFKFMGTPLPENMSDDASVGEYCRKTLLTYWHYHGGCVVGKVVDGNYRVVGVKNLRVVDGSTLTVSPGTNPTSTIMMLGRYVGLKMLQEREANKIATF